MFARNFEPNGALATTATIQQLIQARRKMRLSDAIRSGSGEAARREADSSAVRVEAHWPLEGVSADWQLEEPEVAGVTPDSRLLERKHSN